MAAHDAVRAQRPWLLFAMPALAAGTLGAIVWIACYISVDPGCYPTAVKPYIVSLTIEPGGDAFRSGLRTGDIVDVRALQPAARYRLLMPLNVRGDRLTIPVQRHGRRLTFTFIAMHPSRISWHGWVAYAGNLWVVLFAALIAWRRPQNIEARIISLLLSTMILSITLSNFNWATPWPAADAWVNALSGPMLGWSYGLFVTYAMLFANPPSRVRRSIAWLAYAACASIALWFTLCIYGTWSCAIDPVSPVFGASGPITIGLSGFTRLALLLCGVLALAATRGLERTRMSWAMMSVGTFFAVSLVLNVVAAVWPSFDSEPIVNVMNFALPLGLTYSVLSRRLLDIGFALNLASVFTIVSLVIVGLFMLAEWLMGSWLASQSHATSLVVNAGLVVALGFSSRAIHRRVDHLVDRAFFRRRHEDQQAILEFVREAAFVADPALLVSGAIAVLKSRADAAYVEVALEDGRGCYADAPKSDPAIIALQAHHRPVDLQTVRSAFRGEYAYPMAVGGRLVGALVLGPKRSGEPYAPDESKAIAHLAMALGAALALHPLDAANTNLSEASAPRLGGLGAQS